MDLSGLVMPFVIIDERIPSKAFPDLSAGEIAYLKGEPHQWYLEQLLDEYSEWFMGVARRYEAQKRQLIRMLDAQG